MYYVGIDFGHGETTVSRVPGYNGEKVSQIALRQSNNNEGKKIITALCRRNNQWSLVYGKQDYKTDDIREGFKGQVRKMSLKEKESMREFAKLVFKTILDNDTDLIYTAEDKNFELGIACPSDWVREDPNAQQEYLDFFRNECGLPVDHCIKESDAAFFTKYDRYSSNDSVFVIDLGSSTIDFTTYSNSKCITSCCWGANLGAHRIEDAIMPHILDADNNADNLRKLKEFRSSRGFKGDVDPAISLFVRSSKEQFFTENHDNYIVTVLYSELTPTWSGNPWDYCIGFRASKEEFYSIISNYMMRIHETLINAKTKLSLNGITPNRVLLSGGASRMSFIKKYTEEVFGVKVDVDPQPECVVSNGIALYAQRFDEAFNEFFNHLRSVDFGALYKDADTAATVEAIKELVPNVVARIKQYDNCTGEQMRTIFCNFIQGLDDNNYTYKSLVLSKLKAIINTKAKAAIANAYNKVFRINVDTTDVDIRVQASIVPFANNLFKPGGAWYIAFTTWIDNASSAWFSFSWDRPRDYSERCQIADGVKSSLISFVSTDFGLTYPDIDAVVDSIIEQVINYTIEIFKEKQLFETTFRQ